MTHQDLPSSTVPTAQSRPVQAATPGVGIAVGCTVTLGVGSTGLADSLADGWGALRWRRPNHL